MVLLYYPLSYPLVIDPRQYRCIDIAKSVARYMFCLRSGLIGSYLTSTILLVWVNPGVVRRYRYTPLDSPAALKPTW